MSRARLVLCHSLRLSCCRAQGQHPFVYALAEFIDNSLRATSGSGDRPAITVTFSLSSTNPSTAKGLVCVEDAGCGMSKRELNDWVRGGWGLGGGGGG